MPRSLKKWFYVNPKLEKKVFAMKESGKKTVIKTWSRGSVVTPDFVGLTFWVHNWMKHVPVFVTEDMVGHKLWEFSVTRTFKWHSWNK